MKHIGRKRNKRTANTQGKEQDFKLNPALFARVLTKTVLCAVPQKIQQKIHMKNLLLNFPKLDSLLYKTQWRHLFITKPK